MPPPPLRPAKPPRRYFPLAVNPDPAVLRVVDSEKTAEAQFAIRNTETTPLTLERIETSCPCIRVGGVPVRLEPGARVELKATFSSSDDPDLQGGLSVVVTGYLADGRVGYQTRVDVQTDTVGE